MHEPDLPPRYERIGLLGEGGMGIVLLVRDDELGRVVAMKVCRSGVSPVARSRFQTEARVTAQLEHPGIVPVYDIGRLPTGESYYTMPVIRGRTLAELIAELHGDRTDRPALRRVVAVLHGVCEAMGYAHARGVIHRDLKPENVMVGEHGETLVVDWGLAKRLGELEEPRALDPATGLDTLGTLDGAIVGTPGFMAPEQARGDLDLVDARSDVHALGAMLFQVLTGRVPYTGESRFDIVASVLHGPVPQPTGPAELVEICGRALARPRKERFADAQVMAKRLLAWLDGDLRRARALEHVARAEALVRQIADKRAEAMASEQRAVTALASVPRWASEDLKRPVWRLEDAARALRREADLLEVARLEALRSALIQDPELDVAHALLAQHYRVQHERAEKAGDDVRAGQIEVLLRAHDRGEHGEYLQGQGTVSLVTDPPGAAVVAFRIQERHRRLVPVPWGRLGRTPLRDVVLPAGSWLLRIQHPDRVPVPYPVVVQRLGHWDGVPSGRSEPQPVPLPRPDDLGPGERYVAPGWFVAGGDPQAVFPAPADRKWLDGVIFRTHPVTNRQLLAFLDDLGPEADRYAPPGAYARDEAGRWRLVPDADGDLWDEDWPAILVTHEAARAFAAWEAERTGRPWRLPTEDEWEKAARGVDGRTFPWGNDFDPSWCRMRDSHGPSRMTPGRVGEVHADRSVYGIEGLGGNVTDWCEWRDGDHAPDEHPVRGGAWGFGERSCRSASRMRLGRARSDEATGFRLVRSWP